MNNFIKNAALLALFPLPVLSQGTFVNLDFELANVPDIPAGQFGGNVSITNALPGWIGYQDNQPYSIVVHNNLSIGTAQIHILGPDWNSGDIFQGRYSVLLSSGNTPGFPESTVAIAQTGGIPSEAKSITFYANIANLQVSFGGQSIPLFLLDSTPKWYLGRRYFCIRRAVR